MHVEMTHAQYNQCYKLVSTYHMLRTETLPPQRQIQAQIKRNARVLLSFHAQCAECGIPATDALKLGVPQLPRNTEFYLSQLASRYFWRHVIQGLDKLRAMYPSCSKPQRLAGCRGNTAKRHQLLQLIEANWRRLADVLAANRHLTVETVFVLMPGLVHPVVYYLTETGYRLHLRGLVPPQMYPKIRQAKKILDAAGGVVYYRRQMADFEATNPLRSES